MARGGVLYLDDWAVMRASTGRFSFEVWGDRRTILMLEKAKEF